MIDLDNLNFFQRLIVKNLTGEKKIAQVVKILAGQAAAMLVALIAESPHWLQVALAYIEKVSGVPFNETTLTVISGFLLSEIAQYIANKISGKGTADIQEAVGAVKDQWAGSETVGKVLFIKDELSRAVNMLHKQKEVIKELEQKLSEKSE